MTHYIVFGSNRRPLGGGGSYLDWTSYDNPVGVYEANTPDEACFAAANDSGTMGTFFAIQGHVWGLEVMGAQANRLGSKESANDRLARAMEALTETNRKIEQATGATLEDLSD